MPIRTAKATDSGRGRHPDLTPDGQLRADIYEPTERRDFNRMWQREAERIAFLERVAKEQAELDPWVQQQISGRAFGSDPFTGYQQYRQELRVLQDTLGDQRSISGRDVERMSLAEYEEHFDEHGRPRRGTTYRPTSGRDVDVTDSSIDRFSATELERRQRP
jgi:hypothetical protein